MLLFTLLACTRLPIEDNWSSGSIRQVKDFFTSAFLIETSVGVVLIDSGYDQESKPIVRALEEREHSIDDVSAVIISHGHTDHTSGVSNFPNAAIYAHTDEKELLQETSIKVSNPFADGDILSFGETDIEVFWAAGHTEGNVVLLVDGVLIMGDTAQSYKDGTITPVAEKHSEDPPQAEEALRALGRELEPRIDEISWMVFSHSGPLSSGQALLDFAGL